MAAVFPADGEVNSSGCVKYVVCQFLEEPHYRMLHRALATQWSRLNSLSAAMKLMETYGVHIAPEEQERLSRLPEENQISALVMKMPQQTNEQFQHFFLQLQLLVSTATRVRQGLEEGRPDLCEQALDDADSTGISPYILRMAIVQAGTEVSMLRSRWDAWVKDADAKMGKLIRGQEDAITAQKKLSQAQAQLSAYTTGQNDKAAKVLMSLASGNSQAFLAGCVKGWASHTKQMKLENEIYEEYAERIEMSEKKLLEFKTEQLKGVRTMMKKKAENRDMDLVQEVFQAWKDDIAEEKDNAANAGAVAQLEGKLKNLQQTQAENTKKVLAKLNLDGDKTILALGWQAFVSFHQDYQKNKDFEDKVKSSEKQMAKFMKEKGDSAKKMLGMVGGGSDSVILKDAWDDWLSIVKEAKEEAEMAEKLEAANRQLGDYKDRRGKSAHSVMDRARIHQDNMLLLKCMNAWRMETKVEFTLRMFHARIDAKRQQLVGVQQMFRSFANQLESGLRDNDSARDYYPSTRSRKGMHKSEGTVSLPNIHGKSSSSRNQQPRDAWH